MGRCRDGELSSHLKKSEYCKISVYQEDELLTQNIARYHNKLEKNYRDIYGKEAIIYIRKVNYNF